MNDFARAAYNARFPPATPGFPVVPQAPIDFSGFTWPEPYGGPGPTAPAVPSANGPAPFNYSMPAPVPVPQISAGVGGGGRFTPTLNPDAPETTVDPALASRETFARERQGRIMELIAQARAAGADSDPWARNVWQRVLAMVPGLAGAEPGRMGAVGAATLDDWNSQHRASLDRELELAFMGEEEGTRAAEAGFARQTGEHQVGETNNERR